MSTLENKIKITIVRDGCVQCGSCEYYCNDVFVLPEDEKAAVVRKFRVKGNPAEGKIVNALEACAREAAEACPASVIELK